MIELFTPLCESPIFEIGSLHKRIGIQFVRFSYKRGWFIQLFPTVGIGHNTHCIIGVQFEWLFSCFNIYYRKLTDLGLKYEKRA